MYIIWTIFGILFLVWDLKKTNPYKLVCASSCMFCAIYAYKMPQDLIFQPIVFLGLFLVFMILIKTIFKKELKENLKEKKLKEYIGKTAVVKKDIGKTLSIDGLGQIKFNNELWSAKSVDDKEIKAGASVEIVSKENKIMNVKVINNAKN